MDRYLGTRHGLKVGDILRARLFAFSLCEWCRIHHAFVFDHAGDLSGTEYGGKHLHWALVPSAGRQ